MAANKHTAVGNATTRDQYAAAGQVQDQSFTWSGTAGGTADALTLTPTPAITAYAIGQAFVFRAGVSSNTAATTVAISGLTTIAVQYNGAACIGGEIIADKWYRITLDTVATCQLEAISTQLPFIDSIPITRGSADNTKQLKFEIDGLTTGTTRTVTFPDKDITVAGLTDVGVAFSHIAGFLPSGIAGTSTTAVLAISAGQAADSTNAVYIANAIVNNWAVSNGNAVNGYEGGLTLPNSSTIHFFMISGSSGVGSFASTSLTPILPTGYDTSFRRVFSLKTTVAGALIPGTSVEAAGGGQLFYLTTQVLDVNGQTPGNASRTLYTLSVPSGIKLDPMIRANSINTAAAGEMIMTSPDETDVAPAVGISNNFFAYFAAAPGFSSTSGVTGSSILATGTITTDISGQIGVRQRAAGIKTVYIVTRGWTDFRR